MAGSEREWADSSMLIDAIDRVELRVRSIERAVDFYRDIVGFEVVERGETRASLGAPGGSALVSLDSTGVDAPAAPAATGLFHTAFLYPDRASLADALNRLVDAGYRIGAGDHGVSEALYIDDPDGNGVELYRDRPHEQWPKPAPGERMGMYTAPVDLEDLLSDSGSRGAEPAPQGTTVGHVHLQVSDLVDTLGFYVDVLGLDLMQRMGESAAFMSSRGYHHHIGANTWNSRGGAPAERHRAGLERVILRVSNSDELARVSERLSRSDHEVTPLEDGVSVRDPDGIELRLLVRAQPGR